MFRRAANIWLSDTHRSFPLSVPLWSSRRSITPNTQSCWSHPHHHTIEKPFPVLSSHPPLSRHDGISSTTLVSSSVTISRSIHWYLSSPARTSRSCNLHAGRIGICVKSSYPSTSPVALGGERRRHCWAVERQSGREAGEATSTMMRTMMRLVVMLGQQLETTKIDWKRTTTTISTYTHAVTRTHIIIIIIIQCICSAPITCWT